MEAIPLFIESSGIKYTVVSILALVILIAGCIAALNLIINKRVNKYLFFTMCVTYFAILFVALFLRSSIERVFIFNPLTGLIDTFSNWEMAIQSIMNLAVFIPMGYFCAKAKIQQPFIFSIVISLAIELIQVATMRGFFDVFDILLYFIGIHIGILYLKMADNCGIDILILILIVLFTIFLMTFILNNKIEKEKELYQK